MITFEDLQKGKVKLEFGNIEQIEAIKRAQKEIDEKGRLKKYEVTVSYSGEETIEVEAYDEDEAKELAHEKCDFMSIEDVDYSVYEV